MATNRNTTAAATVSQALKRAIRASDKSLLQLAKEAGVTYAMMHRFLAGETSLSMAALDRLCQALDLELRARE